MKGFILDTDTWIEFFHHRSGIDLQIAAVPAQDIYASEITIAELTFGALHSKAVEHHLQEPKMIEDTFWKNDLNLYRQNWNKNVRSPMRMYSLPEPLQNIL